MGSCIGPELNMMLDALDCALEGVILVRIGATKSVSLGMGTCSKWTMFGHYGPTFLTRGPFQLVVPEAVPSFKRTKVERLEALPCDAIKLHGCEPNVNRCQVTWNGTRQGGEPRVWGSLRRLGGMWDSPGKALLRHPVGNRLSWYAATCICAIEPVVDLDHTIPYGGPSRD